MSQSITLPSTFPPDVMMEHPVNETLSREYLVSTDVSLAFQIAGRIVLSGLVSIFGIITNVINIIVFVKQGAYKECGSVNLLGLAVSDLCVTTTMLYMSIGGSLVYINPPSLPWNVFDLIYVTGGWPHLMSAQITRTITAYVAFERCVCVVYPFKVKTMLSPARSIVINVCIFICFILTYSPYFVIFRLVFKFDHTLNISRLVVKESQDKNDRFIMDIMWYINTLVCNVGSVAIVLTCSVITVSRVKLSKTWRSSMATGDTLGSTIDPKRGNMGSKNAEKTKSQSPIKKVVASSSKLQKEKKLISMVVSLSAIFLACYLPDFVLLLMNSIESEISTRRKYRNLAQVMYSLTFLMETFNSSINILVYYRMSSKYKQVFRQVFGLSTGK